MLWKMNKCFYLFLKNLNNMNKNTQENIMINMKINLHLVNLLEQIISDKFNLKEQIYIFIK